MTDFLVTREAAKAKPSFLSLFAGIGGFDLAFERAGWECAGQCEIDPYARRVLSCHFSSPAGIYHDVRALPTDPSLPRVDLVCGGPPCQDFSVAGHRRGLDGERGKLFSVVFDVARKADARWVLIENVPGVLSSGGGEDWAELLQDACGVRFGVPRGGWRRGGACIGPKGSFAWRVLNAKYFGVPQSRRRVFLVGSLGNRPSGLPAKVLFEPEGSSWDAKTSAEKEGETARCLTASTGGVSGKNYRDVNLVAMTLTSHGGRQDCTNETLVPYASGLRPLTPTERERLQGFPDHWTAGLSDSQRSRLLGNAVAVPVVEWIVRRLTPYAQEVI